jgi:hypothetical protein
VEAWGVEAWGRGGVEARASNAVLAIMRGENVGKMILKL